ncbi:MAG: amidohydrolase [Oscillospiraceae bacterium]|nr:amidohydrolase [Oscillospiraceae bacterium]
MKIIDAHIHYSDIEAFRQCARDMSLVDYSEEGFVRETAENQVVRSVCMGLFENTPGAFPDAGANTPMLAKLTDEMPPGMSLCIGINPHTVTARSIAETEALIKSSGRVCGFKIYAGYYHFHVTDPVFDPVYALAEKYDLSVAIHGGETYSERGLLEYSHPLRVDRLAVAHPDMRIVICHMGAPWSFDACEVAVKNKNVHVDISGLLVGSPEYIAQSAAKPLLLDRYRQALTFMDNYDKVLYGTDWPLTRMEPYIEFCKLLVPPETYEKVFYQNAARVYRLE